MKYKIKALFDGWQGIGTMYFMNFFSHRTRRTKPRLKKYKILIVEFCLPLQPLIALRANKTRNRAEKLYNFN